MNEKKCLLPRQENLSQKNKQHRQTTTDMSISTRHAAKAPRVAKNYGNNGNRIENTPVANNEEIESSEDEDDTPNIIQADTSAGQSLMSSIGIGEYGMNTAKKGNEATFVIAVKEHLFRKIKFLQGKNMEYNLDPTSICGYLRLHCNVTEKDAPVWWEDLQGKLKKTHTDCRNNKIKTIKQQYYGKLLSLCQYITLGDDYSMCPLLVLESLV